MEHQKNRVRAAKDSTKNTILQSANQIISEVGIIDFKIDMLAAHLKLSPGNITYHFPKKEDIASALWNEVTKSIANVAQGYISPLLDIKQVFLLLRTIFIENISYRGVIAYKLSDKKVLQETKASGELQDQGYDTYLQNIITTLQLNGYLEEISPKEMAMVKQTITQLFFWGFLNEQILSTSYSNNTKAAEHYATLTLYPLYLYLTDEGKKQFANVLSQFKID